MTYPPDGRITNVTLVYTDKSYKVLSFPNKDQADDFVRNVPRMKLLMSREPWLLAESDIDWLDIAIMRIAPMMFSGQ